LVENVARDALKLAASARGEGSRGERDSADPRPLPPAQGQEPTAVLDAVDAWQDVIVNRPGQCAACGVALGRGQRAFRGISSQPQAAALWLCTHCIETL